ncbi:hypothetical protein SAMN05880561_104451, partial [Rhizobium sp. RU33A]
KQTVKNRHKIPYRPTLKPGNKTSITANFEIFLNQSGGPFGAASRSVKRLIRLLPQTVNSRFSQKGKKSTCY